MSDIYGKLTEHPEYSIEDARRFTVTRNIVDTAQTGMRSVTFTASWIGIDGRTHTVNYTSYYAQNGLYDYYVS